MVACFAFPTSVHAAQTVPYKINFQGRITGASGTVLPSGVYNMKFKIYDGPTCSTGCTASWSEDRLVSAAQGVTVTNGLFSVQLGDYAALSPSLFTSQNLYFEIELPTLATATGTSPSWTEGAMTPRSKLGGAASALNSDMLDGYDSSYFAPATGSTNYAPISGSANYIQNGTSAQSASFNVSGNGTIGGTGTVTGDFTNNGSALFANLLNSPTAFTIQTNAAAKLFVADTSSSRIYIGNPTADANAVLLVLDGKNTTGDPTGTVGAMYYNTADGDYRAYQNSGWGTIQPVRYVYVSSIVSQTTTSYADVTGVSFSVNANTNYEVSCSIIYQTAATTTGIGIALNGPTSPTLVAGQFISNSSSTALNGRSFNAYNGTGKTTGVQTANANIYGLFNASFRNGATAGTLTLRYASEVGGSAVSIRPGTYCKLTEL